MNSNELYTTGEISRLLRVTPETVRRWIDCGKLHGYMLGNPRKRVVKHEDLLRFMMDNGFEQEAAKLQGGKQ